VTYAVGKKAGHFNNTFKKRFGIVKIISYLYNVENKIGIRRCAGRQ
jgi:hypothetical protein